MGNTKSAPRRRVGIVRPGEKERCAIGFIERLDEPLPPVRVKGYLDSRGPDLRMVSNLIGRYKANSKTTDVLAVGQLAAAADVRNTVVVAAVAVVDSEPSGPRL